MNGHGGSRPGAGRPRGSGSTASRADRHRLGEMIRSEAEILVRNLIEIAHTSEDDRLRFQATIALLDRAYGRPPQAPGEPTDSIEDLVQEVLAYGEPYQLE